ncbi:uncharacterized protein IUM83_07841 [Phytophthora cinnamomi]|uniref:uncharacterized protein n=1 Tax=Phytophthora cinnamomi TaxID=4785 RepID=UPI002A33FB0F|nr:hypothetical protein IUM83_07841 [Phytophthora cinnamomi]KAJ8561728.1 hypothetical protein ON010_g7953 [Phytophthora cinnamomi]
MKKHKSTYTARREEAHRLRHEVQHLTSELQEIQLRSLPLEDAALLDTSVLSVSTENRLLTSIAKDQQLRVASAQSLLAGALGPQESHPLYTRICLTRDWDERRETLMAVREQKLRNAYDFLMAPGRFVDPDKPHTSDHRYETSDGDICAMHFEAMHFPAVESLEKVWEAVLFHYSNIEIDISEKLGHTTVRDEYDAIGGGVSNIRVLSQSVNSTVVESSIATFAHLFTGGEDGFDGEAVAVLALDCIDEDELYPYLPSKRVRLDTSGAIVLTASKRPAGDLNIERELVVTLRRAAIVRLHNPQFPISEVTLQELQAGIGRWGDVLMKTIRSYVYGAP